MKTGTMESFRVYLTEIEGMILLLSGHKDNQSKDSSFAKELLLGAKNGILQKSLSLYMVWPSELKETL